MTNITTSDQEPISLSDSEVKASWSTYPSLLCDLNLLTIVINQLDKRANLQVASGMDRKHLVTLNQKSD